VTTSPLFYILVAVAAIIIGLAKGGFGGSLGVLVAPILLIVMPATDAVGVALPLLIIGDLIALRFYWRRWNTRVIRELLPGTIIGVVLGSLLLSALKQYEAGIRIIIGLIVLLYVVYKLFEPRIRQNIEHQPPHMGHGVAFGIGAGIASTVANSGGPIVSVYFIMHRLDPHGFIGTSALYFFAVNMLKVPSFIASGLLRWPQFWQVAWSLPLVLFGAWLGKLMVRYLPQQHFDKVILVVLAFAAVFLLTR
jgi:uncharacterized membrane protein YfcA